MAAQSQTLRVRITGQVQGLVAAANSARAAIRGVGDESERSKKSTGQATSGLVRLASVMRALGTVALPLAIAGSIPTILGLAAALGQAAGAGLLLPGALLAAASVFGALKIATSGFGEALANVGDPAKFAEAIATLTPAARAAAESVQRLKAPFDALRNTLQERLFAGLAPQIEAVGSALLTTLAPSFTRVAISANQAIKGVLTDLGSLRAQTSIGQIANDGATAFGHLASAARPVVAALLDIAAVGSSFLPGLTAGAGAAAQRFADMVARMRDSGQLAGIIQGGLDALRQLGEVAGNVGSILGALFTAGQVSGGGFLATLVQITGTLATVLNSAAGQSALGSFFSIISTVAATLGQVLTTLAPVIATVLGALAPLVAAVLPGLGAAFATAVAAAAPFVAAVLQLATVALPPVVAALQFLAPVLGPAIALFFATRGAIAAVTFAMTAFRTATALFTAINVAYQLAMGANLVLTNAQSAAQARFTAVRYAGIAATYAQTAAIGVYNGVLAIVRGATLAWAAVQAVLNAALFANPIGLIILAIVALIGIIVLIVKHWDTLKAAVQFAWAAISAAVSAAVSFVGGLLRSLIGFVVNAVSGVVSTAVGGFARFAGAIASGVGNAVGFVASLPGRIIGALGNLGSLLFSAGRNVIQGLINGIKAMIGAVGSAISSVASKIRGALPFSPAEYGPLRTHPPEQSGRRIVDLLSEGLLSRESRLRATMTRIAGSVRLGDALSGPVAAAQEILAQLGRGGNVFEDFSFRGNSDVVRRNNDVIAKAYSASGSKDPQQFLRDYIRSQSAGSSQSQGQVQAAVLADAVEVALRRVFADGVRTDVDYNGLTLRLRQADRALARQ